MSNRMVKLARRPKGMVTREDFTIEDGPVPEPGAGEMRVKIEYISLDPAMRGWMNDTKSYSPPVGLGEVMRSFSAGTVEKSNNPAFKSGDAVQGMFGVQRYAISKGERVLKVDTRQAPLQRWIGGLGMPGWTAYFGLLEVGQPKAGETVVVSAASGAVGSVVGQIAKIKGCRAVGIAGGPDKCRYVTEELGFDACIDYKAGNLAAQLQGSLPQGHRRQFRERRRRNPRHGAAADERVRPHRAVRPDLRPITPPRHRPAPRTSAPCSPSV